ncbi:MAG TPA: transglycosylase SLT domain-containing protein, partial [Desulfoprunum sp.]|nr:transglycosylase SLT domain-containing protein [Desulfoprunum sp.]
MHHRKVKSLVKGIAGAALLIAAAQPHAETAGPLFIASLFSASTAPSADGALAVQEVVAAPAVARSIDLTTQPDNIWDRIRLGFAMTNLNDDLTLHYQQWYQNHPDAMRRMVERSRPYMHHIVEELEARGMPTELALLPMVESSFNPMAYSGAHASGLWQFIPATGKRFNLEQNWWHDQRRDIVASTGAALEYLQTIYEMHGDWHLALASYNWGEGAVKRAIEKNQAKDLPTDYASLTMPKETRHYVPKLQALKNIFSNTTLVSQLGLPEVMNRPYFATVTTSRPMDVKAAARLANMRVDEFVALNPANNRPVMKADTPVVIPADRMATFQ